MEVDFVVDAHMQLLTTVCQMLMRSYVCVCSSGGSASPTASCSV